MRAESSIRSTSENSFQQRITYQDRSYNSQLVKYPQDKIVTIFSRYQLSLSPSRRLRFIPHASNSIFVTINVLSCYCITNAERVLLKFYWILDYSGL